MPVIDPDALTSADWLNIHKWLVLLWTFFPLLITFAFSILIAHAFIPSAVMTGHLPPATARLRIPLTIFGFLALAVALLLFINAAFFTPQMLNNFWARFAL
jgi:hypothetical protein